MKIFKLIRQLQKKFLQYEPLVQVIIRRSAIVNNLHEFQKKSPKTQIAPVLKSNAYGHGLLEVANILTNEPIAFFVVDSLYEAIFLRHNGIKNPLLIIGYTSAKNIAAHSIRNIAFTITSCDHLREVATATRATKRKISLHLKIDTGMHRQGIYPEELQQAKKIITENPNITVEGVGTHLADADNIDDTFTKHQIETWNKTHAECLQLFPNLTYTHVSATAAARFAPLIEANVMRLGIGLYMLKPALELWTKISSIKIIETGARVGYNGTFIAEKPTKIATIPVGYFEGLDRRLSNQGLVKIQEKECRILGRISMNMTTINVTNIPDIALEEPVNVMSSDAKDANSIENMAKECGTIPYEILVRIPQHLRRIVRE